jgi:hypothetical protein
MLVKAVARPDDTELVLGPDGGIRYDTGEFIVLPDNTTARKFRHGRIFSGIATNPAGQLEARGVKCLTCIPPDSTPVIKRLTKLLPANGVITTGFRLPHNQITVLTNLTVRPLDTSAEDILTEVTYAGRELIFSSIDNKEIYLAMNPNGALLFRITNFLPVARTILIVWAGYKVDIPVIPHVRPGLVLSEGFIRETIMSSRFFRTPEVILTGLTR